jgi:hypothetical protein
MSEYYLPRNEDARKTWAENMILKFPPLSASLGFSATERDDFIADLVMLIYLITSAQSSRNESKARTAFKKQMQDGIPAGGTALALPLDTQPAEPEKLVEAGVLPRIRAAVQRMKSQPGYTAAIGEQLQIEFSGASDFNASEGKPKFGGAAEIGRVILDWTKGDFDGVVVESMRGAETTFNFLDKDYKSPFPDLRPNLVAGQPEVRRYRMFYLLDDEIVGESSDEVAITTKA